MHDGTLDKHIVYIRAAQRVQDLKVADNTREIERQKAVRAKEKTTQEKELTARKNEREKTLQAKNMFQRK